MSRIVRREHFKPRRVPLSEHLESFFDFLFGAALGAAAFIILGFAMCPACMTFAP